MTDPLTDVVEQLARAEAERAEEIHRAAILGTDWGETAVLRIVTRWPITPPIDLDEPFQFEYLSFEVERYADEAPPIAHHADADHRSEVATITWPLIERLARDHDEYAEIATLCVGPDGDGDE